MNERIVVPSAGLKLSNLAQPLTVEVIKPPRDQSITVEPSDSHSTKLDLSAVADEKLDSSGKPFPYLDAERDAGRSFNGEQFRAVASVIEDQPVLSEAGKIPPSAANFHDVSIDLLPGGSLPLALLGQEGRSGSGNLFTDAGGASQHNLSAQLSAVGSVPGAGWRGHTGVRGWPCCARRRARGLTCGAAIVSDHHEGRHDQLHFAGRGAGGVAGRPYIEQLTADIHRRDGFFTDARICQYSL